MATDDERREVARSLREIPDSMTYSADRIGKTVLEMFSPNGVFHGNGRKAFNRLAELIEPPTQCPYYRSDRHHCSAYDDAVDRDALLALADDLGNMSEELPPAFRDMGTSIAHRIREALGVEP